MSNSLQPHGLQHIRLPCPSPSPGVCSDSCPLSRWCHPPLSPSPPALHLSQPQGLSKVLALRIRWPKYRSFSFSISPSNEYSWLISFRIIDVMIFDNGCGICVHVAAFPTLLVFRGITHPPEEICQAEQVSSFLNLSQDPRGRRDFVLWIEPPQLGSSAELSKLSL